MSDLISRQAVLDGLEKYHDGADLHIDGLTYAYDLVCKLPSVSTEKTGQWIDTGSGQECSNCHEIQHGYDNHRLYCANCGSRMTGVEE